MINVADINSLSEFQRNAKSHLRRLKRTGKPEILTVNGKAELVVQNAKSYQKLLDELDQAKAIRSIRLGLEQADRGEGMLMRKFIAELAAKAGVTLEEA